ncbi:MULTISPECIES: carboxyl transferase domain-containing protein [unclassified Corynebacterium]|uniref:carboxyl transferase domain-containing protein n=1 Tax=unclassified Corynebacterium TaxID=2624378 RepID=UPI00124CA095|nr:MULTISPECIES: carboxyl transferase domain-containing protein [unclassified Corynebacterium]
MGHTSAQQLIDEVLDPDSFQNWGTTPNYGDIDDAYKDSLARAREKSGVDEAVIIGEGRVAGHRVACVLGEFRFLGGSIGAATARRIIDGIHRATAENLPLLISPSSGGTRMQEGTPAFSLMVSITTAVYRHKDKHLPFLVYLRNPTTGGVMASWGSAGNLTFAEPGALLGFLGPRVVELTTGKPMPPGVQTGENLATHGVIDGVINPAELRASVIKLVTTLTPDPQQHAPARPEYLITAEQGYEPEHSAWDSIVATRRNDRPGLRDVLAVLADSYIELNGTGDGRHSPAVQVGIATLGGRPVVIMGQDRHAQPPHAVSELGPAALRFARRGIQLAHELNIPLISFIDTPGAELSREAEEAGMAGSISRTLNELVSVDVPTVSVILGQGCGGGALAMLPSDAVISAEHGWLSPLPPEGASAIIYRDVHHAAEMMDAQDVSAVCLMNAGIVSGIVPEGPDGAAGGDAADNPEEFITRILEAVDYTLWNLEHNVKLVGREHRFQGYEKLAEMQP